MYVRDCDVAAPVAVAVLIAGPVRLSSHELERTGDAVVAEVGDCVPPVDEVGFAACVGQALGVEKVVFVLESVKTAGDVVELMGEVAEELATGNGGFVGTEE